MNKNINLVFNVDSEGRSNLYPPSQIFVNKDFKFLIALGGWLVDNDQQYNELMAALRKLGETSMYIVEQKVKEDNEPPFIWEVSTNGSHADLLPLEHFPEPPGRWYMTHVFVYGDNPNWGIYVCEYPTILIIGCIEEYLPIFRKVYDIKGNGFAQQDDFISQEYGSRPLLRDELIKNYHLQDND
jgi:hypothetical protein